MGDADVELVVFRQEADDVLAGRHQVGLGDAAVQRAVGRERRHGVIGQAGRARVVGRTDGNHEWIVRGRKQAAAAVIARSDDDHNAVEPQDFHGGIQRAGVE